MRIHETSDLSLTSRTEAGEQLAQSPYKGKQMYLFVLFLFEIAVYTEIRPIYFRKYFVCFTNMYWKEDLPFNYKL